MPLPKFGKFLALCVVSRMYFIISTHYYSILVLQALHICRLSSICSSFVLVMDRFCIAICRLEKWVVLTKALAWENVSTRLASV